MTPGTVDAAKGEREIDTLVATGEVADLPGAFVVVAKVDGPTRATNRFFRRRRREISAAGGLQGMVRISGRGTKPGKRYRW
jgi:hypothetical protein